MPLGFGAIGQYALAETPSQLISIIGVLTITSNDVLQLPVDCVMMGDQIEYKITRTVSTPHNPAHKTTGKFKRSGLKKLG